MRGDYASYADDIAAAGRHLLSVVHAMSQGVAAPSGAVDLIAAASEAISLVAASGQAKRIAVDLMASSRIEARGDKRGIVQIIVNILGNAIRHSPPDSVVTINIVAQGGRAFLTIADQGPGIAPEDQRRIFERFERLGTTEPGTGLGLAIARRLADEMGGGIHLQSAPGEGARFTVELPLA
ncbi:MAG: HAMP domain-containing histidine kinase [Sphingomonadales bacterium]|nr:HAMP domain-containing histidine kinase [Sphingomonadales bacterium]